jgi:hypothetical protein
MDWFIARRTFSDSLANGRGSRTKKALFRDGWGQEAVLAMGEAPDHEFESRCPGDAWIEQSAFHGHSRTVDRKGSTNGTIWLWAFRHRRLIPHEDLIGCDICLARPLSRRVSDTAQQEAQTQVVHNLGESGYRRCIERSE